MMTTLDLPQEIIAQAQKVAAARRMTLQALVEEGLRSVLGSPEASAMPAEQALARLRAGFHLGGARPLTRDEAHAR